MKRLDEYYTPDHKPWDDPAAENQPEVRKPGERDPRGRIPSERGPASVPDRRVSVNVTAAIARVKRWFGGGKA